MFHVEHLIYPENRLPCPEYCAILYTYTAIRLYTYFEDIDVKTYSLIEMLRVVDDTLCLPMTTKAMPSIAEEGSQTIFWTGIATNILTAEHFEIRYENVFYFDPENMEKLYTVCNLVNPYLLCLFDSIIADDEGLELDCGQITGELAKIEKVTDMTKAHELIKLNWRRDNENTTKILHC